MLKRVSMALIAGSCIAAQAPAAIVDLLGDLGSQGWAGVAFSPIASPPITTNFTHTFANGTVTGDAVATNVNGFSISLKLTNLTFTTFSPGPNGMTEIELIATHHFHTAGGAYFTNHFLSGSWSSAVNNLAVLNTIVDFGSSQPASLAGIGGTNTGASTSFNFGGAAISGNSPSIPFTIQMHLRLRIDGVGTTFLPNSAEVLVDFVPAPSGLLAFTAFAGLAARRKRR